MLMAFSEQSAMSLVWPIPLASESSTSPIGGHQALPSTNSESNRSYSLRQIVDGEVTEDGLWTRPDEFFDIVLDGFAPQVVPFRAEMQVIWHDFT